MRLCAHTTSAAELPAAERSTTTMGAPRNVRVAAPAFSALLCAALALSLLATASSTGNVPRFSRSTERDLAFCVPLSPRCFNGRRAQTSSTGEVVASASSGSRHLQIAHTDCITPAETQTFGRGPSLDSPVSIEVCGVSTPRKHLGPTAEEIVAQRRQEALVRKSEVFSSWSPAEESAEDGIQAYGRPASIGIAGGNGGRHLGPTLDEVAEISRQQRTKLTPSVSESRKVGKMLGGSGKFELVEGGPSRQQVHALLNLGITVMPKTKEEAAEVIREMRDMQMGNRLGMQSIKKDGVDTQPAAATLASAGAQTVGAETETKGPEEHLNMALRGLNMITRRAQP